MRESLWRDAEDSGRDATRSPFRLHGSGLVILCQNRLLDELKNNTVRETPARIEPGIDYVVTKIPRFAFEKFLQADPTLTTQMKSVGEAMAIGRTFKESLQ